MSIKQSCIEEYKKEASGKKILLEQVIGVTIKEEFAIQAITCSAFANEYNQRSEYKIPNHDALATVGDAILKAIISTKLFHENPLITKGNLTDYKKDLESNITLQTIGEKFNLENILLHRNTDLEGNKKIATAIEAIIGAIFISNGLKDAEEFVKKFIFKQE